MDKVSDIYNLAATNKETREVIQDTLSFKKLYEIADKETSALMERFNTDPFPSSELVVWWNAGFIPVTLEYGEDDMFILSDAQLRMINSIKQIMI